MSWNRYWQERMKIGILAELTGVSARMLRHYEDQGLLHPERLGNGYRDYPEASVMRVLQIRDLLTAGLSTQAPLRSSRAVTRLTMGPVTATTSA